MNFNQFKNTWANAALGFKNLKDNVKGRQKRTDLLHLNVVKLFFPHCVLLWNMSKSLNYM